MFKIYQNSVSCNIVIYALKFSLDFKKIKCVRYKIALVKHLLIKTDYLCCESVADKLISDIFVIYALKFSLDFKKIKCVRYKIALVFLFTVLLLSVLSPYSLWFLLLSVTFPYLLWFLWYICPCIFSVLSV